MRCAATTPVRRSWPRTPPLQVASQVTVTIPTLSNIFYISFSSLELAWAEGDCPLPPPPPPPQTLRERASRPASPNTRAGAYLPLYLGAGAAWRLVKRQRLGSAPPAKGRQPAAPSTALAYKRQISALLNASKPSPPKIEPMPKKTTAKSNLLKNWCWNEKI